MPSIRQVLTEQIPKLTSALAARSILNTLPALADRKVGALDLVDLQSLLAPVETGLKTFGGKALAPNAVRELRRIVTGGAPARAHEESVEVKSDADVLRVQRRVQAMNRGIFSATDCVRLATVASELARNIYMYAKQGSLHFKLCEDGTHYRFDVHAKDEGPGIPNLEHVLSGKYVSRTGMGRGLVGTKALLDGFELTSAPGKGTEVRGFKRVRRS